MIEPVCGDVKEHRGMRRFARRRFAACAGNGSWLPPPAICGSSTAGRRPALAMTGRPRPGPPWTRRQQPLPLGQGLGSGCRFRASTPPAGARDRTDANRAQRPRRHWPPRSVQQPLLDSLRPDHDALLIGALAGVEVAPAGDQRDAVHGDVTIEDRVPVTVGPRRDLLTPDDAVLEDVAPTSTSITSPGDSTPRLKKMPRPL